MIAECLRRRVPIPAPYDDPPTIDRRLFTVFLTAFEELSAERRATERTPGQVIVHRIEARAIRDWCDGYGMGRDRDFIEEMRAYIGALDSVWVELEVKRLKTGNR